MKKDDSKVSRRSVVASGLALGGAVSMVGGASALQAETRKSAPGERWDLEADIVCVGSGCAALTAAIIATGNGDKTIVLEKERRVGGTTAKSGAVHWIPNNRTLRAAGVDDVKLDALRYMVRFSYPNEFVGDHPTLGVPEEKYRLIEALYDNGAPMVDRLVSMGVYQVAQWRLNEAYVASNPNAPAVATRTPDYLSQAPENKVSSGRAIAMSLGNGRTSGTLGGGVDFIATFTKFFEGKGGQILTEHPVVDLVTDANGAVIGAVAKNGDKRVRIRARKGVIFGTGGYAQNTDMLRKFLPTLPFGTCAGAGSQGDFIPLATKLGAALGNMPSAWWANVPIEQALKSRVFGSVMFCPSGDSMVFVNKNGKRFVDEFRSYSSRGKSYQIWDSTEEEYPNHVSFMVFDQRTVDIYGGNSPIPRPNEMPYWVIKSNTLDQLGKDIAVRLETLRSKSVGVRLSPDFTENLKQTVSKFNNFARSGVDEDFKRGKYELDKEFFAAMSMPRDAEASKGHEFLPNHTMYPFSNSGPYYAVLIGVGLLDTNGGPVVNEHAQVVDYNGRAIPGLYGAGNCIAAPSGAAYYGPGGTVGPGMTFGYIAANHAHGAKV